MAANLIDTLIKMISGLQPFREIISSNAFFSRKPSDTRQLTLKYSQSLAASLDEEVTINLWEENGLLTSYNVTPRSRRS